MPSTGEELFRQTENSAITSTRGKNFSHNLSIKKVRYLLLNATITNCILKKQILRDYVGGYGCKNNSLQALILNDTSIAKGIPYNPYYTFSLNNETIISLNSQDDIKISKFRDSCIVYKTIYHYCLSSAFGFVNSLSSYPLEIVVYGALYQFNLSMNAACRTAKCAYYGSNGYEDVLTSNDYTWASCSNSAPSGYSNTAIKLKFYNGQEFWQYYIQNTQDKTLQKDSSDNPIIVTSNTITYDPLIKNQGIYIYDSQTSDGSKWICFQDDGELHVTVEPEGTPSRYYYSLSDSEDSSEKDITGTDQTIIILSSAFRQ